MRPFRQINFIIGLLLLIGGGGALMVGLRNTTAGFYRGGFNTALAAPNGWIDLVTGFVLAVVGLALLRAQLRSRLLRLFVVAIAVLIVLLAVHAGSVGAQI
jgi:hypothetical protein